jgi:hypothetical protein
MSTTKLITVFALVQLYGVVHGDGSSTGCRGGSRTDVDWWMIIKYPSALTAAYADSISANNCTSDAPCWSAMDNINAAGPLNDTLSQLRSEEVNYIMYNDADPGGTEHWSFAHAKGVVAFSATGQGWWLTHSAPRYPDDPSNVNFTQVQRPQTVFAQHFFCISLAGPALEQLFQLLLISQPYCYSHRVVNTDVAPTASLLVNNTFCKNCTFNATNITSTGGLELTAFSKSPHHV